MKMCACGRPLHYSDPNVRRHVERLIRMLGENARVRRMGDKRVWLVPRHYIALHGLKAEDLGTDKLPKFEEVTA